MGSVPLKTFCYKMIANLSHAVYLYVDHVKDIVWNNDAFEQLVLPHEYKQIVWAFVDAQLSGSDNFDDVVRGKGNSGAPL